MCFSEEYLARKPLGKPKLRWYDNIKVDLNEIGFEGLGWIYRTQDRQTCFVLVNTIMNI